MVVEATSQGGDLGNREDAEKGLGAAVDQQAIMVAAAQVDAAVLAFTDAKMVMKVVTCEPLLNLVVH